MNTLAQKLVPAWPRIDFWLVVTIVTLAVLFILLILPIFSVFLVSFFDGKTGELTLGNYVQLFTRNYYIAG